MQPAFKIILRTYHALTLQSKVNRMKETLESAFSSKRFFFYSVHCLCYLSKKLENTISFPHSFFLFHLENIDFASPCDSYAAQVNMACLIYVQVSAMPLNSLWLWEKKQSLCWLLALLQHSAKYHGSRMSNEVTGLVNLLMHTLFFKAYDWAPGPHKF